MSDVLDEGADLAQRERDGALQMHRQAAQARAAFSAMCGTAAQCHECGDPIPENRRAAAPGCTRCIKCEREVESRHKLLKR